VPQQASVRSVQLPALSGRALPLKLAEGKDMPPLTVAAVGSSANKSPHLSSSRKAPYLSRSRFVARTDSKLLPIFYPPEMIHHDLRWPRMAQVCQSRLSWPGSAGLITRRSQVQILPPLLRKGPGNGAFRFSSQLRVWRFCKRAYVVKSKPLLDLAEVVVAVARSI
jgi:hypothetical protein